jgi:hypothetical protein
VKLADTPTRLVGAENETGKWIRVDHKLASNLSFTESQHRWFESSQYSKNILKKIWQNKKTFLSLYSNIDILIYIDIFIKIIVMKLNNTHTSWHVSAKEVRSLGYCFGKISVQDNTSITARDLCTI